jgi:hypothetical protein
MEDSLTEEQQEIVESAAVSRQEGFFGITTNESLTLFVLLPCRKCCMGLFMHGKSLLRLDDTIFLFGLQLTFVSSYSYIVTNRGMHAMYEKYRTAAFGRCPHVFCQGQPVLPVGLSDLPRNYTVNVFCPRCHGLFFPKSTRQANIDGAYFGTTFPHLYLMTHPVSLYYRLLWFLIISVSNSLFLIFRT